MNSLPVRQITNHSSILQRVLLYPGEVYRVPLAAHHLQFTAGRAWVSHRGQDMIVNAHEHVSVAPEHDVALISPLGESPLVIEVMAN